MDSITSQPPTSLPTPSTIPKKDSKPEFVLASSLVQNTSTSKGKDINNLRETCDPKKTSTEWAIKPNFLFLEREPSDGVGLYLHPNHQFEFYFDGKKFNTVDEALVSFYSFAIEKGSQIKFLKIKYFMLKDILRAKLVRCKQTRMDLMSTKSRIIVLPSKNTDWGIGVERESEYSENPCFWTGKNLYGLALMELRAELYRFPALKRRYTDIDGTSPPSGEVIKKARQEYDSKYNSV